MGYKVIRYIIFGGSDWGYSGVGAFVGIAQPIGMWW